jgi:transposase
VQVLKFEKIIKTEKSARRYIIGCCEKTGGVRCQSCGSDKAYVIENGERRRCARCGHSFHPLQGRWIHRVKISSQKWLWIIKLFELDNPTSTISEETGISYPTVLKAVETIRWAIIGDSITCADVEFGCSLDTSVPILGASSGEHISVQVLETIPAERIRCTGRLAGGWMICADKNLTYGSLMYGNEKLTLVDKGEHFPRLRIYFSGMDGFWQYTRERLTKRHGISLEKLMLYIREMEFRYMHRDEQLFDLLVEKLCQYASLHSLHQSLAV